MIVKNLVNVKNIWVPPPSPHCYAIENVQKT